MSASAATLKKPIATPFASHATPEERRFQRILAIVAGILLILSVVVPYLPLFEDEQPLEETPRRVVKLVVEQPRERAMHQGERPQPSPAQEEAKVEPEPEAAPQPVVQAQPEPQPRIAPQPTPEPSPVREQPSASEQAQQAGILAMRDSLADLADDSSAGSVADGPLSTDGSQGLEMNRDLITSRAGEASGGIELGKIGRGVGGGTEVAGRDVRRVDSPVGALPPPGGEAGKGRVATRTNEEIQLVFDRNKNSVYGLYNQALREEPGLQGRVVLQLTIAPSGAVTAISVLSSELDDPRLERTIAARVEQFDFGAKDVPPVTITYPIEFFPAS